MKVLVTGGTGFVGQEVVQALYLTHDVRLLVRDPNSPVAKRLINHCCLWAEYGRRANANNQRRWSPFRSSGATSITHASAS